MRPNKKPLENDINLVILEVLQFAFRRNPLFNILLLAFYLTNFPGASSTYNLPYLVIYLKGKYFVEMDI